MSTNKPLVDERQRDLGNFLVGRLLPVREKRQVGPFTFIDHMGPSTIGPDKFMDVDQHPHIGLCTLTYLFEGEIEHRDSIGSVQIVHPGDVGFMTSGKGVTHTERTPRHHRDGQARPIHGYQIWVALPKDLEEMEPRFDYFSSSDIPAWSQDGLNIRLAAGEAFGRTAPLKGYSHMFMVDVLATNNTTFDLGHQIDGEVAFVIVKGSVQIGEEHIHTGQMLVSKTKDKCSIQLEAGTRLMLFGGEPLPEERFLSWNFVSADRGKLKQAKIDWENRAFPKVPGDNTYVPFPS